jgi:subtilisin family serine protease
MPTLDARADKPEVVGPDGVNNTFFGADIPDPGDGSDTDTFPNFPGTSAAAPHVAGVAALMRQVSPSSSPVTIYSTLDATAIDMGPPGFDNDSGFGLVQAVAAVCSLTTCTARTAAPVLSWLALAIVLTVLLLIGVWHLRDRPRRPQ